MTLKARQSTAAEISSSLWGIKSISPVACEGGGQPPVTSREYRHKSNDLGFVRDGLERSVRVHVRPTSLCTPQTFASNVKEHKACRIKFVSGLNWSVLTFVVVTVTAVIVLASSLVPRLLCSDL
jgi:hypothetical protein